MRLGGGSGDIEECTGFCNALSAGGVGKEAVVADAVEALGQYVQQEAAAANQSGNKVTAWQN